MTREEHWKIVDAVIDAHKDNEMGGKYSKAFNHGVLSAFNRVCKALEDIEKKQLSRDCKTCENINEDYADCDQFKCSECQIELKDWHRVERDEYDGEISYHEYTFKYCPNCGRRLKEVEKNEKDNTKHNG